MDTYYSGFIMAVVSVGRAGADVCCLWGFRRGRRQLAGELAVGGDVMD